MRALALALLLLCGCASKEATIGCQAADAGTTLYALHRGAVEANPLMAKLLAGLGAPGFLLAKAAVAVALLHIENKPLVSAANGTTCAIAIHNLMIL